MKTTAEMIAVMQAYAEGKPIEVSHANSAIWKPRSEPAWNWGLNDYRVALTKPSVDWSHISPKYRHMATDSDGITFLYNSNPSLGTKRWVMDGRCVRAEAFSSFTPGTCDWKDSLVLRPEGV